jgi:hypothetical protein
MSTSYCLLKKVRACELFDGRLEAFGIREHVNDETTERRRCLTDGRNYVWVCMDESGDWVEVLTRYAGNASGKILNAVAEAFETDIVSEYEPQFWGFDTQEEWDAWQNELAREHEKEFCAALLKFLRGESHGIRRGTNGFDAIAKHRARRLRA